MPFETSVAPSAPAGFQTPLLGVVVPQGTVLPASLTTLDAALDGALSRLYAAGDFSGKRDETVVLYPTGPAGRVTLVGVGKVEPTGRPDVRRASATVAKRARTLGVPAGTLYVTPESKGALSWRDVGQGAAEGLAQGAWVYNEMKRPPEEPKPTLDRFTILAPESTTEVSAGHKAGAAIGAAQSITRGLQVLPGNVCTPTYLGRTAEELGRKHGFAVTVLDKAAIEREKMGALLSIAQGSVEEPRFIVLEYKGSEAAPIVLVGKGVTFDTGGISIKPAQNMEDMKFDMSGAAAVLGTFEMLGRLKPKVHVVGLIPSTENMPSGTAVKPGDVITSHFGKTIEMINTDAEGRLILCDALSYARRFHPACVLDIATLTGAIVVALGHTATGVMGTDDKLIEDVRAAGERAGERVWPLPLWDEYRDLMKSDIADVKNAGGRPAGSISAGWFLREFVEGFPWAHLDIAGTAWQSGKDKGSTGRPVPLLTTFLIRRADRG